MKKEHAVYAFLLSIFAAVFLPVYCSAQNVNNSFIAHTIPEKDLLPESITYDSRNGDFFIGSTRKGKVLKISPNGHISDFITSQNSTLYMVVGLRADVERRILWICSSGGENLEGYELRDDTDGRPAGVFKFDLDSGRLIKKYVLNTKGEIHFFNDLVVMQNGDVYISHMFDEHSIYKITTKKDVLEKVFVSSLIKYPNGLAVSRDESKLYVAHSEGIALVELKSGKISSLQTPKDLKIARRESIDGLYWYNNTLIGIHPDIKTVQQFQLNAQGNAITKATILELNHPMMNNPTTGEVVKNELFYIANAQFGSFDENGALFPLQKLYEPTILKIKLND